jgi:hypothetical protein
MLIITIIIGVIVYLFICIEIGKFCAFNDRYANHHSPQRRAVVLPPRRPDLTNTTGRNP